MYLFSFCRYIFLLLNNLSSFGVHVGIITRNGQILQVLAYDSVTNLPSFLRKHVDLTCLAVRLENTLLTYRR